MVSGSFSSKTKFNASGLIWWLIVIFWYFLTCTHSLSHTHTHTHTAVFGLLSLVIWRRLYRLLRLPQPVCWDEQREVPVAEARGLASSVLPRRSRHQWLWGSLHGPSATPAQIWPPLPVSQCWFICQWCLSSFVVLYTVVNRIQCMIQFNAIN